MYIQVLKSPVLFLRNYLYCKIETTVISHLNEAEVVHIFENIFAMIVWGVEGLFARWKMVNAIVWYKFRFS